MKLIYTPRSHFARKVRILLDAWGEAVELVDAGDVASTNGEAFAGSPLMAVPALVTGDGPVFDSDNIARFLAARREDDEFQVNTDDVEALNARVVMNGIMTAEVEVILAKRTGVPVEAYERFTKKVETIRRGLDWLEDRAAMFSDGPSYAGFHLVSMWDHLELYGLVELDHPALRRRVATLSELPIVSRSRPPR